MNVKKREDMIGVFPKGRILMWGSRREPGHGGVHHHTRPQHSVNGARPDSGPPPRRAPRPQDRPAITAPLTGGCSSTCPPMSAPNRRSVSSDSVS